MVNGTNESITVKAKLPERVKISVSRKLHTMRATKLINILVTILFTSYLPDLRGSGLNDLL